MSTPSQLDDNMIPGQTYTFQLKLGNLISMPSTGTVQQDIVANAPAFISNLQVTTADTINPFNDTYNLQFTYTGDGSDVVSDVASSLIAATQQGSNDKFSFVQAIPDTADSTGTINQTLDSIAQGVTKTTANAAQNLLTPVEWALVLVVGLVVLVIFTSGKAGGVSASAEGLKIGG